MCACQLPASDNKYKRSILPCRHRLYSVPSYLGNPSLSQHASLGFISSTTTHAPSHLLPNLTVLPPTRPSRVKQRNDKPSPLDSDERAGENNIKDRHLRAWTEEAGQRSRSRSHTIALLGLEDVSAMCHFLFINVYQISILSKIVPSHQVMVPCVSHVMISSCNAIKSPTSPLHQPKQ